MGAVTERRVTSLIVLLIAAALLSQTFGQAYSGLGAFSPMFFPQIVLGFWVAVAALDVVSELRRSSSSDHPRLMRVSFMGLATLLFLYGMTRLGFFLSAVPFSITSLVVLGLRNPLAILAVGVGVPAALVALFNHLLVLPLPTSPFTWWF
ncbi:MULTISPECIES: tripartite tricarboxylate transporter TctB family protein [Marivita]|uniref:Tripartite tricarboxylate transporter TctB family protein n=1 Tax=Marivita cryptomonadis TaxID=505252 RepID=A0A9Q2NY31_9RHOB|nr:MULTISPECIES: tripartite tricarboxylate transporter TctB family protein [Marivita]MCR9168405.1 tripartite tricarboxylate transporter TctB family protein [Paracoccaceae bacterium]MBM2321821.1 tripartite tricarboxylate transporter TctB family protein [Marivita cryptomonadis]MBM2331552.1 tripartite tricarboxylate transporter TctB family protein [Marivita cryptomonadis]MBM2341138.1 tripartite tricarboxylate transporter TctB family protein [Marivita cryptomonadis]MBM2345800.1 tripartite tricarbo